MRFQDYIEINPSVRFGKPIIIGTRITVYDVLNLLANGLSKAEILEDYPKLNEAKINACLLFAANKENPLGIAS